MLETPAPARALHRPILLACVAAALFVVLALAVTTGSANRPDLALSTFIRAQRSDMLDGLMVLVTMLGDYDVISSVTVAAAAALLLQRKWWSALGLVAALIASSRFVVPMLKTFFARPRPTNLYHGAEAFSFPSGHATNAMTLYAILAVLFARNMVGAGRTLAIGFCAAMVFLIALSRVYLGAHWPADVMSGLCIGGVLAAVYAALLGDRECGTQGQLVAAAVLAAIVFVGLPYVNRNFGTIEDFYLLPRQ